MDRKVSITDVHHIISNKILSNRIAMENLQNDIKHSLAVMQIKTITTRISREKINLISNYNQLLEQQLVDFTEERQAECNSIAQQINILDTPTTEYKRLITEIETCEVERIRLLTYYNQIEQRIPKEVSGTKYTTTASNIRKHLTGADDTDRCH